MRNGIRVKLKNDLIQEINLTFYSVAPLLCVYIIFYRFR